MEKRVGRGSADRMTTPGETARGVSAVEAVVFDMDGLMFDTERLAMEGWMQAGKSFGLDIPRETAIETAGRNSADTRKVLERGLGRTIPYERMRELRLSYAWRSIERFGVPVKAGLVRLLDLLDRRRVPRAVATSTDRPMVERLLELSGLSERFPLLVCGDEVSRGKPAPDIFLAAAEGLGAAPAGCAVLEDSESGIRAAHRAGMIALLVPDLREPGNEVRALASGCFPSLVEAAVFLCDHLVR